MKFKTSYLLLTLLLVLASSQAFSEEQCNEFTFDATSSINIDKNASIHWDFGDGTTSNKTVVSHTYKKSGKYKAIFYIHLSIV